MTGHDGRVLVFASTRADLFPLAPVLTALAAAEDLEPVLFATGTTGNRAFGNPLADLETGGGLDGVTVESGAADLGQDDDVRAGGIRIAEAISAALDRLDPAACVVLGDRWELLFAVPPIVVRGVPLVHLHGGEVTEGAVDDRIRHAVTKLADLHCVSTADAAARLRQLGEPADRIYVTGAPSLDRIAAVKPAGDDVLRALVGDGFARPFALVTYHPPTASGPDAGVGAKQVLDAVAATVGSALITHPGLDRGHDDVLEAVYDAVRARPNLADVPALGAAYLPTLAAADLVVGNSSSGILEAASFGVPVVNVGDRQLGRTAGANVVHVAEDRDEIEAGIRACLDPEFRTRAAAAENVYGDGHAAPRIVDVIRRATRGGLARKPFVDIVGTVVP